MLHVRVVILLPDGHDLSVRAGYPPEDRLDSKDMESARRAWTLASGGSREDRPAPGEKRFFTPMRTGRGAIGVVGIECEEPESHLSGDKMRLFDSLADQTAPGIAPLHL